MHNNTLTRRDTFNSINLYRTASTSVQGREAIESSVILIDSLLEVVCGEVTLAQPEVQATKVVEVEGAQALPCVGYQGRLGGGA